MGTFQLRTVNKMQLAKAKDALGHGSEKRGGGRSAAAAAMPAYEKEGRHLMEWENDDLTTPELKTKLAIAVEGKDDDQIAMITRDLQQRKD